LEIKKFQHQQKEAVVGKTRMNLNILNTASLKTKLTLFTLLVFLIGVWSLAWYATSLLRAEMEQQIGEQQFSTVSMLAENINEGLADRLNALELIARTITPAMMANPSNLQDYLERRTVFLKLFNNGVFVTPIDGTVIVDVPRSTGRLGVNYIDRDFMATALKDNRSNIGAPVIGRVLKVPVFGMATPIHDAQGKIIGLLAGTIDLSKQSFLDRVAGSKVGKTGGYLLISPRQRLAITATDKYFTIRNMPEAGINPLFDRYVAGFEGYGHVVDSRGVSVLSAAKGVSAAGWVLIGRIPASEALAPISTMQRQVLLATLLFTFAAGCLIWLMTWRMLKHQLSPMISATEIIDSISDPSKPLQPLPIRTRDEIGLLIASFNRLLEIMQQREATKEEALSLLQKIASRVPGVVFQFRRRPDGSACVPYASEVLKDIFRISPENVREDASAIFAAVHPDDLQQHLASIAASAEDLSPWYNEYRVKFGEEPEVWLMGTALPEREADGSVLWHGVVTDITERKRSEVELDQYRLHLEELVEERTRALSLAKEAAEAASRAKSTFLANMSHELRTPLNAIMGMTSIVLRRTDDPKTRDQLGKIDIGSHHLLAVINDILDISKVEAGRMTLEQGNFMLGESMENITSLMGQKAADKGLALHIDLPPALARLGLRGDALRLGQILLNLTGNAVKFTETGTVTVRVGLLDEGTTDVRLRFDVQDTGIGVTADDQKKLFTAFEQADGTMTRKYGGTGLGLAISKRLVHLMGGDIGVDSQPGVGSNFWFTVLLGKSSDVFLPTQAMAGGSAEILLKTQFSGTRILLAEDEPINQEVSRNLLEDAGLQVDLAENGAEALAMAREKSYDLILMDMQMPVMNGIDATRAIRALPNHSTTPILAMTANAFDDDRHVCIEAGMNEHIGKPVQPDKLFETLLKWLSQGKNRH
jgi:signal transduction histidine kinase/ActR/RegA family two-component response regulator/HAMP domain-containing protein